MEYMMRFRALFWRPFEGLSAFYRSIISKLAALPFCPSKAQFGFTLAWVTYFSTLWLFPAQEGLSAEGHATLAVVSWASIMWIFEVMPVGITGILIPMLLIMSGAVQKFPEATTGFSNPIVFLCLAAFLMAAVIHALGLDRRLALSILHQMQVKTVNGVIWTMFGVNMLLSLIIPAANARAATLLPVINGITHLFGDTEQERAAKKAIVIQTLVYGSMISGMCIITAHLPNMVLSGLFSSQLNLHLSYVDWFKLQWPYLGMFVITQWWVQRYFKTKNVPIPGGISGVEGQFKDLLRTSFSEWAVLAALVFVGIMWMTEDYHKIKSHISALIGLSFLFMPGLFSGKWKDIQDRTFWGAFLLLAGALSMSDAMSSTGLGKWLSDLIHPFAANHPWWLAILILMLGTHVIRLGMLSNVAVVTMLAPVLLALSTKLGFHPVAFTMLVADTDTFAYILPTQITAAVIAYSSGTFSTSDYAKVGIVSVMIAIAYGIIVMAPWYAYMGIPLWDASAPWPFAK